MGNCKLDVDNELLKNLDELHTTELVIERIERNTIIMVQQFEWLLFRIAPLAMIGAIAGVCLTREKM